MATTPKCGADSRFGATSRVDAVPISSARTAPVEHNGNWYYSCYWTTCSAQVGRLCCATTSNDSTFNIFQDDRQTPAGPSFCSSGTHTSCGSDAQRDHVQSAKWRRQPRLGRAVQLRQLGSKPQRMAVRPAHE